MKKINWGIVSTGRIAHQFASDFKFVNNGNLLSVCSRNIETAKNFANQHGISKQYSDYSEFIKDKELDVVYIASPHTYHAEQTIEAIINEKAVLCEKPFTISKEELLPVLEESKAKNIYVMEAMWTYFLPAIKKAQQWVNEGRIGDIKHIKADFGYPQLPYSPNKREYNKELGGGALLEMGIYPIALAWLFLKEDPKNIKVIGKNTPNGVEDDVSFIFDYGYTTATLGTSFRCKLQNWAYIIGEEGYIAIPDFWRANTCSLFELDTCIDQFNDGRKSLGLNFETEAVTEDLLNGSKESKIMPLEFSIKFQDHIEQVKKNLIW